MSAYTEHAAALFQAGKKGLASLFFEMSENLIAVTQGDPTAPKIKQKIILAAAGVIDGLAPWGGIQASYVITHGGSPSTGTVVVSFSNDGVTYGAETLLVPPTTDSSAGVVFVDTVTGVLNLDGVEYAVAGAGAAVSHIKFGVTGGMTSFTAFGTAIGGIV
tara:strand:- start:1053 stop:1535 length:483 start_codon:yes stop_codon:yes gene_type:complete